MRSKAKKLLIKANETDPHESMGTTFSPRPFLSTNTFDGLNEQSGFLTSRSRSIIPEPSGMLTKTGRDYFQAAKKSVRPQLFGTGSWKEALMGIENPMAMEKKENGGLFKRKSTFIH